MKKSALIILILVAALAAAAVLTAAVLGAGKKSSPYISDSRVLLDTTCAIRLYDNQDPEVLSEAFDLIARYESLWSPSIPTSDVSRVNAAGGAPVEVDPETVAILKRAVKYSELSGGVFDVTIGALTDLWDVLGEDHRVPSPA